MTDAILSRPVMSLLLSAGTSLLLRALGPASAFALTLLLARQLGAENTGYFFLSMTLITALAMVARCGLDTALQRLVGQAGGCPHRLAGIGRRAWQTVLLLALPLTGLCWLTAPLIAGALLQNADLAGLVRLQGLMILPLALLSVHAALLKALEYPALGTALEVTAWPALTLLLLLVLPVAGELTGLAGLYLLAVCLAAAISARLVARRLPATRQVTALPWRTLWQRALPLAGVDLMNFALLWLPFLLLPLLANAAEAGVYNVSHRLAALPGLLMPVCAAITSVRFARYWQQGNTAALSRLAGHSTRLMTLLALPPVLLMLGLPGPLLGLFGEEFVAGAGPLAVLALGQLGLLALGPAGYLLAMSGHEKQLRNLTLITTLLSLPLCLWLLPAFGAWGAAWVVTLTRLGNALLCARLVRRRLPLPGWLLLAR
ncbi:lipopolysaccharide biosynthesis protein [Oceanimonas marisflavi]|uniref:lipopolysaccharide biosynthesis protein n=1 Tax=Oceanimonas marisflavi TaxID=2059724 RepID=UPI000D2FAE7F|nr:oligosaccharide flippase family protein [Oceanimonas marisflavi]